MDKITYNPTSPGYRVSLDKRIMGLDELRGIAALLVVVAHWCCIWPTIGNWKIGAIGVDVFFIISGFLIGSILIRSRGESGFFRTFFVRRAFRIIPLAAMMVALGVLVHLLKGMSLESLPYYLTFTQNFIPVFRFNHELTSLSITPLIGTSPMWSLAVEEHTYIALPFLFFFLSEKKIKYAAGAIALTGCAFTIYYWAKSSPGEWYTNHRETWARMHYIAFGVLLIKREYLPIAATTLASWLFATAIFSPEGIGQVLLAMLITATIFAIKEQKLQISSSILKWIGLRCYGVYLLHYPISRIAMEAYDKGWMHSTSNQIMAFIAYIGLTLLAAFLSFKYFEMPIQMQRSRFEPER